MIAVDLLSESPRVRHGFFTRQGGVSEGLYGSLNCGLGSADDRDAVVENRRRVAASLGAPRDSLTTAYQIHSDKVLVVDRPWEADSPPSADGLVTSTPGVVVGALAADCAPVLFAEPDAGVVAAAHAGWKGALGGIVEATVAAMCGLGARRDRIRAVVGPAIGPASYEVGPEFRARFVEADPSNARFFTTSAKPGHHMFDLPRYVGERLDRLALAGVDVVTADTCADENRFFSYRRSCLRGEPDYGRGVSAIVLDG
ncbi:YfiH family protein [Constrictibacter sp. MBR-5]|uniref:peptidoglycan editing factor PgeF n=1 Tax=Constrictibacter sp. MBR-5 TaxID=3156467 RepID=UPI0033985450